MAEPSGHPSWCSLAQQYFLVVQGFVLRMALLGGGRTSKWGIIESGVVVHTCDPSTQGVKTGGWQV